MAALEISGRSSDSEGGETAQPYGHAVSRKIRKPGCGRLCGLLAREGGTSQKSLLDRGLGRGKRGSTTSEPPLPVTVESERAVRHEALGATPTELGDWMENGLHALWVADRRLSGSGSVCTPTGVTVSSE